MKIFPPEASLDHDFLVADGAERKGGALAHLGEIVANPDLTRHNGLVLVVPEDSRQVTLTIGSPALAVRTDSLFATCSTNRDKWVLARC